uniref:Cathepsin L n=1 Tax=Panagrolaimus sp. PS1159 TaxID=55785 RepID=A0AC35FK40_9BILA
MFAKIAAGCLLVALVWFTLTCDILSYKSYKRWKEMRDYEHEKSSAGWIENEKWLFDHIASNATENQGFMKPKRFPKVRAVLKQIVDTGMKDWKVFKAKHRKNYTSVERERERMLSFINAEQYSKVQNEAFEHHNSSYKVELNDLADLSFSEYKKLNGFRYTGSRVRRSVSYPPSFMEFMNSPLPDAIDWREHGYVTDVKDQGNCGSCWAFSAIGSLEGQYKRRKGNLITFSEQNLVDCSRKKNDGCDGGFVNAAFQHIMDNRGISAEETYPYRGKQRSCLIGRSKIKITVTEYVEIPAGDEKALKVAVATMGPISVAIDTDHMGFMLYKEGVFYDKDCSSSLRKLDHAVLVVGYGTDEEFGDYWIVKNSWGDDWGMHGYIKMARNRNNNCGIASEASYPVIL